MRGLMIIVVFGLLGAPLATHAGEPLWKPDDATVKAMEATLALPSRDAWIPGPLHSYARYYIGVIMDGHRVIYGDLLRGRMAREKPGIYLRDPPNFSTGGGCDQVQLWFDVDDHQMLQIQCYGLG